MVRLARKLIGRKVNVWEWRYELPFPRFSRDEDWIAKAWIYDVRLKGEYWFGVCLPSKKFQVPEHIPESLKRMWLIDTAKKIDIVVLTDYEVHLVEVKRKMLSSGIGQLLLYKEMFREYYRPTGRIVLWYVTYTSDPDVVDMCKALGIKTWSYIK